MKCCRKMKQMQRAHLTSMGRERDMAWQRGDVDWRRGDTREGIGRRRCQLCLRESYWTEK
jgi:hypothetical protein